MSQASNLYCPSFVTRAPYCNWACWDHSLSWGRPGFLLTGFSFSIGSITTPGSDVPSLKLTGTLLWLTGDFAWSPSLSAAGILSLEFTLEKT
ncbi:hypothetical protein DY000_02010312 [Brassica cretica]|uniref:Uncharacterized protein n=1 Tax=Brassica cretica TaxID=69181 RepID=A0ABQ7CAJ7_BRACR|nr:hypothetical protein DY000_02010312 [Brassica cretica]